MLAALPGVREIRSALVGGYLWILFLWLVLDPGLGEGNFASEPYRSAHHLGDAFGTVALGVAISFVAYLIGTGANELRGLLSRAYLRARGTLRAPTLTSEERMEIVDDMREKRRQTRQRLLDAWDRLWRFAATGKKKRPRESDQAIAILRSGGALAAEAGRALGLALEGLFRGLLGYGFKIDAMAESIAAWAARLLIQAGADPYKPYLSAKGVAVARRYLARVSPSSSQGPPDVADLIADFPVLRMRLIHASPDAASEVDRLNAEADFRSAITLPLLAIAGVFAIKASLLFLVFWPLLLALRMTAKQRRYDAGELMIDALSQGVIEAPSVSS